VTSPPKKTKLWDLPSSIFFLALFLSCAASAIHLPFNSVEIDGWRATAVRLFGSFPGAANYAPTGGPALLWGPLHWLANFLGLSFRAECFLCGLAQNLLAFLTGVLVYRTARGFAGRTAARAASAVTVLVCLSSRLPQCFWSELVCLFLMAATLYHGVRLYFGLGSFDGRRWILHLVPMSFFFSILVCTRIVPALFLAAIGGAWLARHGPSRRLAVTVAVLFISCATSLAGFAYANHLRFGRFELADSGGEHLWNGVSPFADSALRGIALYERVRAENPGLSRGAIPWYRIELSETKRATALDAHRIFSSLSWEAIRRRPDLYLREGLRKFRQDAGKLVHLGPMGLFTYNQPEKILPALAPWSAVERFFDRVNDAVPVVFETLTVLVFHLVWAIGLGALLFLRRAAKGDRRFNRRSLVAANVLAAAPTFAFFAHRSFLLPSLVVVFTALLSGLLAARSKESPLISSSDLYLRVIPLFFLGVTFFGATFVSFLIEEGGFYRYQLPYLPELAIAAALALDWCAELVLAYVRPPLPSLEERLTSAPTVTF
jgi:hypothetical protein